MWTGFSRPRLTIAIACVLLVLTVIGVYLLVRPTGPGPAGQPQTGTASFVVAFGEDGVALTDGRFLEKVAGPFEIAGYAGPRAVLAPGGFAAFLHNNKIVLGKPGVPPITAACNECAGLAVIGQELVTGRNNLQPGNGFDLVFFDLKLTELRTVPAQRLPERVTTDYPQENTESPSVLAASGDRITMSYLARDGGVRRGPSIIAQYSATGQLTRSAKIDGIVRLTSLSPDGHHVALGVGGNSSWCESHSDLVVVSLDNLEVLDIGPALPSFFRGDDEDAWTILNDLAWQGGNLIATSKLYSPQEGQQCDFAPEPWTRTVNPSTLEVKDAPAPALSVRNVGPACGDVVTIKRGEPAEEAEAPTELISRIGGAERSLGRYWGLALDPSAPKGCR